MEPLHDALDRLQRLAYPELARRTPARARERKEPPFQQHVEQTLIAEDSEFGPSVWDPEPLDAQFDVSRCRALLLEVMRRAIHDWVLYRNSSRLELKQRAEDAYTWLFEENATHAWRGIRKRSDKLITSFESICEEMDLDVEFVRERAKATTIRQIVAAGRPSSTRSSPDEADYTEHGVETVSIDALESVDASRYDSYVQAHFHVSTPDYT